VFTVLSPVAAVSVGTVSLLEELSESLPQAASALTASRGRASRMRGARFVTPLRRSSTRRWFPIDVSLMCTACQDVTVRQAICIIWSTPAFRSASLIRNAPAGAAGRSLTVMIARDSMPLTAPIVYSIAASISTPR
jgi:hypothetical protein